MEFLAPTTKAEALGLIAGHGRNAVVMAGGTNLSWDLKIGFYKPAVLVHLGNIAELARIEDGDRIAIGATVTHRAAVKSGLLGGHKAVTAAAATIGGWQTQNVGTVGGNLCNAAPSADLMAPLLVHGARVTLESAARGARSVPLEEFILAPRRTACAPDEMLTAIDLDPMPGDGRDAFVKVRRRHTMDSPILSVAVRFRLAGRGGAVDDIRVAVSGAAPVPYRARKAEDLLAGQALTDPLVAAASDAAAEPASPIDDARGSAAYRLAVLPRVVARALREAQAGVPSRVPQ